MNACIVDNSGMTLQTAPLQWAIFCRVIDNFGDLGVCWRLSCDLAQRGHRVQLWLDDSTALAWMAPHGCPGVEVLAWHTPWAWPPHAEPKRVDVILEAFGCEIAIEFMAVQAANTSTTAGMNAQSVPPPVWINLEYLSAEPYVERCHALPSLQSTGPGAGWTKWFFYPGFTPLTGGLLREPDLAARRAQFDPRAWLAAHGLPAVGEKRVSLFCYEPAALPALLQHWALNGLDGTPVRLLVAAGRPRQAVQQALAQGLMTQNQSVSRFSLPEMLSISYFPRLTQTDYDHLLWASDLNFVRGEDSLVRALWAGQPWVWQIYPQTDGAHHAKLQALMDRLDMPASLQAFHRTWNHDSAPDVALAAPDLATWQGFANGARSDLGRQADLVSQLLGFVAAKKS